MTKNELLELLENFYGEQNLLLESIENEFSIKLDPNSIYFKELLNKEEMIRDAMFNTYQDILKLNNKNCNDELFNEIMNKYDFLINKNTPKM